MKPLKSKSKAKVLKGWDEIAEFMRVKPLTLRYWHQDYGLPIIKLPKANEVFAVSLDLIRWLRIWRVRDYLEREGSIRTPPELDQIKRTMAKQRRRKAYHQQKKTSGP